MVGPSSRAFILAIMRAGRPARGVIGFARDQGKGVFGKSDGRNQKGAIGAGLGLPVRGEVAEDAPARLP